MFSGKEDLMAGDQEKVPGEIPDLVREFIAQFRGVTEKLELFAGLGESLPPVPGLPSLPGLPAWPAPGALSATQLESIAASVSAQRRSIETLKTQLAAFDEQLAVLERILEPLAEWSRVWAGLEQRLMNMPDGSAAEEQADGS
jgi:hypothetical protein